MIGILNKQKKKILSDLGTGMTEKELDHNQYIILHQYIMNN